MTVLYFADTRFPIERANGIQTMATCHALAGQGVKVRLIVRPDSAPEPRDPYAFYGLAPVSNLTVTTIPGPGGPLARRLAFLAGAMAVASQQAGAVAFTRDLGLAAWLARLPTAARRPMVYESHGIASLVSADIPRRLGTRDAPPSEAKLARLDRRERLVWQRADAYVSITRALAADLESRYGARAKVFVVPDGARQPASPPSAHAEGRPPSARPIAAYAGHLYPWKGVDVFVRALAQAPSVNGLIVGGHPGEGDRERIERLAADLGISERLEITGLVPPADVATHLARASVLVLPNTPSAISERYTSPLKLFEYLWIGRPIIASDLPAIREILTEGETALFVPPADPSALAAALERVGADPALAASLGKAARDLAPSFTWERRAARLLPVLDAAMARA